MVTPRLQGLGSGAISGIDWEPLIQRSLHFEREPVRIWRARQSDYRRDMDALRDINMRLTNLQERARDLRSNAIWNRKRVTTTGPDVVVATPSLDAVEGRYDIRVRQLATQSISKSTSELNTKKGAKSMYEVRAGNAVVNLEGDFSTTNFDNAIDGSIKINGYTYNIADYSTVRQLMDDINDYSKISLQEVVPGQGTIDITKSWDEAGFENIPVGTVTINGVVFNLSNYSTVKEFMDEINDFSKVSSSPIGSTRDTSNPINEFFGVTVDGTITINHITFTISDYTTVDSLITAVNNHYFANATLSYDAEKDRFTIRRDTLGTDLNLSQTGENPFFKVAKISLLDADATITYDPKKDKFTISRKTLGTDLNLAQTGENPFFKEVNINTAHSSTTIRYDPTSDKFYIEHDDPNVPYLKLEETPGTKKGFFTEVNIPPGSHGSNVTGVDPAVPLYRAGFDIPIGVNDHGTFRINNVEIQWDADEDTLNELINRINTSRANVTAFFDPTVDKIILTSKSYGPNPIRVSDVSGNFALNILKLPTSTPTEDLGSQARFTINSTSEGDEIARDSNMFRMNNITFTLKKVSREPWTNYSDATPTTIEITRDLSPARYAIEQFVNQYNSAQNFIRDKIKSDPDPKNRGDLSGDVTVIGINTRIRGIVTSRYDKKAEVTSSRQVTYSPTTSIDVNKPFDQAGFDRIPQGKVLINNVEFDLATYTGGSKTVQDFMNDVRLFANVRITYDSTKDRFTVKNEDEGEDLVLTEKDVPTNSVGFFRGVNITPGIYETLKKDMNNLADIGITTGKYKSAHMNLLVIDSDKLNEALERRPDDVRKLFAMDTDNDGKEDYGVAEALYDYLDSITRPKGVIRNKIDTLRGLITGIDKSISDFEDRLALKEKYLRAQFRAFEEAMGRMQSISTSIMRMFSRSMPGAIIQQ